MKYVTLISVSLACFRHLEILTAFELKGCALRVECHLSVRDHERFYFFACYFSIRYLSSGYLLFLFSPFGDDHHRLYFDFWLSWMTKRRGVGTE